ncbi:hypothetical protein BC833DRAFT_521689 [Globomyces pollinis-pini]|nr:hypothetical protein BC833DRAFT_521689 [Globomyces pollinis-pini]
MSDRVHEVVHQTEIPFHPKRVICIPVDESDSSKYVIDWAMKTLIQKDSDEVLLLHCRSIAIDAAMSIESGFVLPAQYYDEIEDAAKQNSFALLKSFGKLLQDNGVHCKAISLRGSPREELELKINRSAPDMVVMGSRGLGAFSSVLLGSVSQHLVHHSKVPVLIVPQLVK